ncbi:MAG: MerR family transcriptional regulator [Pseudomonadota bacterium]
MMNKSTKLKIGELAQHTGLTVRTLHHYDAIGLLTPSARSDSGYRLYNSDDMQRLYRIMTLSRMGVPLADIDAILAGGKADLGSVVADQIRAIELQLAQGTLLRERLLRLQEELARTGPGSLPDAMDMLEVMAMTDKYFSHDDIAALNAYKREHKAEFDAASAEWPPLIERVRTLFEQGAAPDHPDVAKAAQRWQELVKLFTGGDPAIAAKAAAMYKQEGTMRNKTGIDEQMFAFMGRAIAALNNQGATP